MHEFPAVDLAEKVGFLGQPDAYPDHPESIKTVETHFAWVFLSDCLVYKLKKPIQFQSIDYTSLKTRRANCELEVTLNRRLADGVYIGVVPLCQVNSGLQLEGGGPAVEWLVKMHRLPEHRTLDQVAREGTIGVTELRVLLGKLAAFYRQAARAPWTETAYVQRLDSDLCNYGRRLSAPELRLSARSVDRLVTAQRGFVQEHAALFKARISQGWVVDAHGDLRPEHIFLTDVPQIIDCLEFSTELRLLDSAAEIAFLALECERMGQRSLAENIVTLYRDIRDDPVAPKLLQFYRSMRALVRALLSAWHLVDGKAAHAKQWLERANWYLDAAQASISDAQR